jgi:hypothetical protein
MPANKKEEPYKPAMNVQDFHKALKSHYDPLSGNCSQEYRNWLDSNECRLMAEKSVYADVFTNTKTSPAELLDQVIKMLQTIQNACNKKK